MEICGFSSSAVVDGDSLSIIRMSWESGQWRVDRT